MEKGNQILLLETYDVNDTPYDGLTNVFHRIAGIAPLVKDTSQLKDKIVLTAGIPSLYRNKVSHENINVVYTTFESDRLPDEWVTDINNLFNYCIVPHEAVREVFLSSGVHVPVSVIHQGYTRFGAMSEDTEETDVFTIGFLGVPVPRKNLDKIFLACKVLKEELIPDLKLCIHVSVMYSWVRQDGFETIFNTPWVEWTTGPKTSAEMVKWFQRLSCYIYPSSGEGWSFTPRESMYLGIPTIISGIPVHEELCKSGYYHVIAGQGKEKAWFGNSYHGCWDSIELSDIALAILNIYGNYSAEKGRARNGARWIARQWENDDMKDKISHFLHHLAR